MMLIQHKHQQGFSLIEVMIGMIFSLIIVLGILQIFIGSKRTYRLENGYVTLQEQTRFTTTYLSQFIRLSGFRTPPSNTLFPDMSSVFNNANPYIFAQNDNGANNSDILTIRYQGSGDGLGNPDGTVVDCLNQAVDANTIVTMTFSITANNQLQCRSQNPSAPTPDVAQVITNNVENMQIIFGEDLDNDKTPDRFVAPNHPNLNANRVLTVKIALLLRSDDEINLNSDNSSYFLLGTQISPPQDGFLRIPVTTTIHLRNLVHEVL